MIEFTTAPIGDPNPAAMWRLDNDGNLWGRSLLTQDKWHKDGIGFDSIHQAYGYVAGRYGHEHKEGLENEAGIVR